MLYLFIKDFFALAQDRKKKSERDSSVLLGFIISRDIKKKKKKKKKTQSLEEKRCKNLRRRPKVPTVQTWGSSVISHDVVASIYDITRTRGKPRQGMGRGRSVNEKTKQKHGAG